MGTGCIFSPLAIDGPGPSLWPDPIAKMRAWLRDVAARPEHHQASAILAEIPADTTHKSGLEARRYAALAQAATTPLEAARHMVDAIAFWKDYALLDDAFKWQAHSLRQAARRKGKTKLSDAQQAAIKRRYEAQPAKYGAVVALAGEFDVCRDTVRKILMKKR